MSIFVKTAFGFIFCAAVLLLSGCQAGNEQQLAQRLEKIEQKLEKISKALERRNQAASTKQTAKPIVKSEKKMASKNAAPKVQAAVKVASAAVKKVEAKVEKKAEAKAKKKAEATVATASTKIEPKAAPQVAQPEVKAEKSTAAGQISGDMLEIARFDAKNFNQIPKMANVTQLTTENDVVKVVFKQPLHAQLFLGYFEGEELLIQVNFAHLKKNHCFMSVSCPGFVKRYTVEPSDKEITIDTIIRTKDKKKGINISLSGTQHLKSIVVYRLK